MKILLDVDGVLADFTGGACRAHGAENPYYQSPLMGAAGQWDLASLLDLTEEEFWAPLRGARFWRGLEETFDGGLILRDAVKAVGARNVCLLTNPSLDPEFDPASATGKLQWIADHLPGWRRRCLIGEPKHFCAHTESVLIDDNDKNVETFIEHGGGAILVPRAWNGLWQKRKHAAGWVQWCLEEECDEQE